MNHIFIWLTPNSIVHTPSLGIPALNKGVGSTRLTLLNTLCCVQ
jgi:hypothetical protein